MGIAVPVDGTDLVASRNPAVTGKPWSRIVMVILCLSGLLTPYLCLAAAPAAFALSDQDDGLLLVGIGGAHLLLTWMLLGAI
jgi:hypothetical protein